MKHRFIFLIASLLIALSAMAETEDVAEIMNVKTPKHVQFQNYVYAITLPNTGYKEVASGWASSFVNEHDDVRIDISQPAEHYLESLTKRVQAGEIKPTLYKINGQDAWLNKSHSEAHSQYELCLFYNGLPTPVILSATYPDSLDALIGKSLTRSLLSLVYVGPEVSAANKGNYETPVFSIASGKYLPQCMGVLMTAFSRSGNVNKELESNHKDFYQVMQEDIAVKSGKRKKMAVSLVNGILEDGDKVISRKAVEVNGLKGFEFDIERVNNGKVAAKEYAAVLFTDKRLFLFVSVTNENMEANINEYKQILRTFKVK